MNPSQDLTEWLPLGEQESNTPPHLQQCSLFVAGCFNNFLFAMTGVLIYSEMPWGQTYLDFIT